MKNNLTWQDAEDVARAVLDLPEDCESDDVEIAIAETFDVSFESFYQIVSALMPFTIPAKAAISGEVFQGFVKDGAFIAKMLHPSTPGSLS